MKRTLFFFVLIATVILCSCQKTNPVQQIVDGYPIIPIRMHQPVEEHYLTDYVPSLIGLDLGDGEVLPETMDVADNGHIQVLTLAHEVPVVVLPNLPVCQALFTTHANAQSVTIAFAQQPAEDLQIIALVQNRLLDADAVQPNEDGTYVITTSQVKALKGRSYLRIFAADRNQVYNDILVPLQDGKPIQSTSQLDRHDDQAQVLYSLMIDRFENGNPSNDRKLNDPEVLDFVDYQGGDFQGITNKINEGWFDSLGITTLWISPITQNPWDAWGKYPFQPNGDGTYKNKFDPTKAYTKFSGYHGYWPIFLDQLEHRFGTEQEFKAMLDAAHRHNMNVVLDYVANHMHIDAPTFKEHPDWHTDSILPDGRRNFELWDEARLTTWFDIHIPSLDLEREEVCDPMTDSALYWLENYELDGFRHDACKHIPLNYWRMLGQKMAQRFPGRHIWMIGETYGNPELIGSYVKSGMLPAQFDFNIYHTAIDVLGKPGESMQRMARTIEESLAAYGAHHSMGNISGNHDKCRFISLAGGAVRWDENDKEAGWTRYCGVTPDDNDPAYAEQMERAYKAAMLLEVINLTIPGVPCIYQGDEFGAAGANDPDNRAMMRFTNLSEREQQFRHEMESLIAQRRHSMPLLYGDYLPVSCTDDVLVFDRVYMGEKVRVTIDKHNMTYTIE